MYEHVRTVEPRELSPWKRLQIRLLGPVYAFSRRENGCPHITHFYYSHCRRHGYYVTYPQGFDRSLPCPTCLKKLLKKLGSPESEAEVIKAEA